MLQVDKHNINVDVSINSLRSRLRCQNPQCNFLMKMTDRRATEYAVILYHTIFAGLTAQKGILQRVAHEVVVYIGAALEGKLVFFFNGIIGETVHAVTDVMGSYPLCDLD